MIMEPPPKPSTTAGIASPSTGSGVWSPSSWRTREARQMPKYDDPEAVREVEEILAKQAPLVFAGEVMLA